MLNGDVKCEAKSKSFKKIKRHQLDRLQQIYFITFFVSSDGGLSIKLYGKCDVFDLSNFESPCPKVHAYQVCSKLAQNCRKYQNCGNFMPGIL